MEPTAKLRGLEWMEIEVSAPAELASEVEILLTERHLGGWVVEAEEPLLRWVVYVPCAAGWEERLNSLREGLRVMGVETSIRKSIVDEDWANCWKQYYHPRKVGQHLVICPSWEEYQPAAGERVITLDPGMAFGTGLHASTSTCLELLEAYAAEHELKSVLDVGTGSGILAIAAVLLGAERVLATDYDSVAVRVARENAEINGVAERIAVREAVGVPEGRSELILANLIASLLVEFAPALAAGLMPGGRLICSGIVQERRDEVVEAMEAAGLVVERELNRETWVSMQLRQL